MELAGSDAEAVPASARPSRGMSLMVFLALLLLPLPASRAEETATRESLSAAYMLYAASRLCSRDFDTVGQKHLDTLLSAARELERTLDLSAEEIQALWAEAESAAAALHSLATPQNQWQQCEQLRELVETYTQGKQPLDSF